MNSLFVNKSLIERSNIKFPFAGRRPPELVFPITIHSSRVQQREKGGQYIYLPVVGRSKEANIPLIGPVHHNQMVCNMCILVTCYVIQNWESFLKGHLTTPHHTLSQKRILDPFPRISLVWLQSKLHPFLIFFQSPTPCDSRGFKEHQPAQVEPYFASTTDFHQAPLSWA
jgi:hypothetical protein